MKFLVLGAGVIGLTTALELIRTGNAVHVWAKELSPKTTSDVAAAFWSPYYVNPIDKVTSWAGKSYNRFKHLSGLDNSGIRKKRMVELFRDQPKRPEWASVTEDYNETNDTVPPGFKSAYSFTTYVMDMSIYMPYLMRCCEDAGVSIKQRTIGTISEVNTDYDITDYDIIVNCTGLGSREICNDQQLIVAKGQVVRTQPVAHDRDGILLYEGDGTRFSMIVPRINDTVLGGTYEENFASIEVDPLETGRIIEDCRLLSPDLYHIEVLGSAAGLRPVRPSVRLELERIETGTIIHNYGHGGAGVTLSWGCAQEVVELAQESTKQ